MSKNIFENAQTSTYSFVAGGAVVTWSKSGQNSQIIPVLMQDIQIQYQRTIQPLFPVNVDATSTNTRINVIGRPQGTLSCTGLLAPFANSLQDFLDATGAACITKDQNVTLTVSPFTLCSADQQAIKSFTLKDVILQTTGITIQAGDTSLVTMPLQFMFTTLAVD